MWEGGGEVVLCVCVCVCVCVYVCVHLWMGVGVCQLCGGYQAKISGGQFISLASC